MSTYRVEKVPTTVEVWRKKIGFVRVQAYTIQIDGKDTYPYMTRTKAYATVRHWREADKNAPRKP